MKLTFRRLTSPLALGVIWLFLGAFLIDAANLDDLVPGNVVLHPDSDEESCDQPPVAYTPAAGQARTLSHDINRVGQSTPMHHVRLVIDQDSPSLAAESLVPSLPIDRIAEDTHRTCESFRPTSSLYLLNCSLLM